MVLGVAVPIIIQNGITNFVSLLDNIQSFLHHFSCNPGIVAIGIQLDPIPLRLHLPQKLLQIRLQGGHRASEEREGSL